MPDYIYTAKNRTGETKEGHLRAINKHELAALLRGQGLVLISAETAGVEDGAEEAQFALGKKLRQFFKRIVIKTFGHVPLVEKMMFSRHLAVMIDAGLALNQALNVLAEQTKNIRFKSIIVQIETRVRQGETFSRALSQYPKVFGELYINMIKIGETSGNLSQILKNLAEQMRKDHELISRVRAAMMYPAVIVIAMVIVGILMMTIVVPELTNVFSELDIELPITTRVLIKVSDFLQNNILLGLISLVIIAFLIRMAFKTKRTKELIHKVNLHVPILGPLIKKINSARFSRTFSSLIKSGVPIIESLRIVSGTLTNIHFKKALLESAEQVQKGKELSKILSNYKNIYPPMVIQMIGVGEKTGSLAEILENLAAFYEEEIDNTTKGLSSVIEPVIMIVIGAAIGFFAISVIQPIYSMMEGV